MDDKDDANDAEHNDGGNGGSGGSAESGRIEVYARIRPTKNPAAASNYNVMGDNATNLEFVVPKDLAAGFINNSKERFQFAFRYFHSRCW